MTMTVTLVAQTTFEPYIASDVSGYVAWGDLTGEPGQPGWNEHPSDADELAEFAGRNCYQAWKRLNQNTATNKSYLSNIITQGHFSVLEHASMTLFVTGISRSFLTELERHRHLSFSVVSQRYVDESEAEFIKPPDLNRIWSEDAKKDLQEKIDALHNHALGVYGDVVEQMIHEGFNRKDARSAARSVLPNGTETKIVVTGNHRTWREIVQKRMAHGADREIQAFAAEVLRIGSEVAPGTYQDLVLEGDR